MSMQIDKQNGNICFNEGKHVYFDLTDPKKKYISVTTLLNKFEQPFDKDFWSAYKAMEQLVQPDLWPMAKKDLLQSKKITPKMLRLYEVVEDDFNSVQQNILDGWQKENLASTTRGTAIHSNLEHSFYKQKTDISLKKYGVGGKFVCDEGRTALDLENGVYPEYLIWYDSPDNKLHIAGQIDVLAKEGNSFTIIDWKGLPLNTPIPTYTGWKTMESLKIGDKIFDMNGNPCAVIHKSEIHHNPCYRITFTNGIQLVADHEHRWLVSINIDEGCEVMTTEQIADYMELHPDKIIEIPMGKKLDCPNKHIVSKTVNEETIEAVLRASVQERMQMLDLLAPDYIKTCKHGNDIYYQIRNCDFSDSIVELIRTLGVYVHDDNTFTFPVHQVDAEEVWHYEFEIKSVEPVDMVPTQCIEVDSPTHTFLCTKYFIVTHNTNKQIKTKSYFDSKTKTSQKLKYPLNNLDDCNYSVYNMQLSTYAWMIQQMHPEWKCNDLVLVHFDHSDKMTTYHMKYLKDEVERMLRFWKKESILEQHRAARKPIQY